MTVHDMIRRLVAFPTVSRDSNLALIDFVADWLDGHGVRPHLVYNEDRSKANLYASVGPQAEGGVVLSGHTDVVPVDGQDWSSDPFRVVERDGRLYGRGTADMKSFLAIALALVPEMDRLRRPIHLALSYDEEVGCRGAPAMIEAMARELPPPLGVIIGEPTDMQVVTAHKGILACCTRVRGYETHSSQTHRGVSAVMTGARLISFLDDLRLARQRGPQRPGFEPGHTTVHVGTVHGGTAINIIARHCEFLWDVRNVPDDDPQAVLDAFRDYCDELQPAMQALAPDTGIDTQVLARAPALSEAGDARACELALALTGQQDTHKVPYATEGGQFQRAGFSAVVCGPGSIDQAHQPDEYVSLSQVDLGTDFVRKLIGRLSEA